MEDSEVDQALQTIADQNRPFVAKADGAEKGDRVTMSFQGTIGGEPFEGGSGEDIPIVLGSGQFIPGFEARTWQCLSSSYWTRIGRGYTYAPRSHLEGGVAAGSGLGGVRITSFELRHLPKCSTSYAAPRILQR